jgi:hypothetical protein
MSNESSDAFKIRRAPSGKFYVRGDSEAICLPNGSLRYFETQRDAWAFLTDCDRPEIDKIRRIAEFNRDRVETAMRRRQSLLPDDRPPPMSTMRSTKRAMNQGDEGSTSRCQNPPDSDRISPMGAVLHC